MADNKHNIKVMFCNSLTSESLQIIDPSDYEILSHCRAYSPTLTLSSIKHCKLMLDLHNVTVEVLSYEDGFELKYRKGY